MNIIEKSKNRIIDRLFDTKLRESRHRIFKEYEGIGYATTFFHPFFSMILLDNEKSEYMSILADTMKDYICKEITQQVEYLEWGINPNNIRHNVEATLNEQELILKVQLSIQGCTIDLKLNKEDVQEESTIFQKYLEKLQKLCDVRSPGGLNQLLNV